MRPSPICRPVQPLHIRTELSQSFGAEEVRSLFPIMRQSIDAVLHFGDRTVNIKSRSRMTRLTCECVFPFCQRDIILKGIESAQIKFIISRFYCSEWSPLSLFREHLTIVSTSRRFFSVKIYQEMSQGSFDQHLVKYHSSIQRLTNMTRNVRLSQLGAAQQTTMIFAQNREVRPTKGHNTAGKCQRPKRQC
jgi:hypothetical protein